MRDFEKISFEMFRKFIADDKALYDEIKLPTRDSSASAGYDIFLVEDVTLAPNESKKIPTGIKARFPNDEVLLLIVRSSTGIKYNIRLCNQVGVVDADYYNNPDNEGHIVLKLQNESTETYTFKKGYSLVQGIFMKYLTTESDPNANMTRRSNY